MGFTKGMKDTVAALAAMTVILLPFMLLIYELAKMGFVGPEDLVFTLKQFGLILLGIFPLLGLILLILCMIEDKYGE